ncbi:MAG: CoB--CoM heterodisulfide reductase iron-sulfur subunit A family protein [Chloroflexi bacterium]|nr:CoB--CoM heterodisulfide reductase iron-sulfur subunit A family protein [Chloroflexota bacterium]
MGPARRKIGTVMVVGGGVSGVQASLDLAATGYKVCLVDEAPTIGGRMAQLDKTFPTNDCSTCILSPKLVECYRNPNIRIITNATVKSIDGDAGNFSVKLVQKPRYVDESKCVGCGNCSRYCPLKIPDPFNQNISETKAIRIPFAQAVPMASVIDPERCLFLKNRECKICFPVCKNKAIDFKQVEKEVVVDAGALILSTGYRPFDPSQKYEYGYGRYKNVITSLEYERLSTASGPSKGEIRRPSDGSRPDKIAWIQCVGSRDAVSGNHYCSAVCCTYTAKQVVLAKEHYPDVSAAVFFNDIRAFGKGFDEFHEKARGLPGVRFLWSAASVVGEDPASGRLSLRYCKDGDEVVTESFDLVVLSVGMVPSPGARDLMQAAGISSNAYGFCEVKPFQPGLTSRPGIFASGAFMAPMDIPESVASGSAAVSLCSELLSGERVPLAASLGPVSGRPSPDEDLRIGLFVCRCGANIGSVVNVPEVVDFGAGLRGVVYTQEDTYSCGVDAIRRMAETIKEKNLNRVVLAACTPRTHEPLFKETLKRAGLNPYLFEMANIREQCSWVHSQDKELATEKARDLVRMAVAKSALLRPLDPVVVPVEQSAMVIGGGIAGMTAALSIAEQGYPVHLVEKSGRLGGLARRIKTTQEGIDVATFVDDLVQRVGRHPRISTYLDAAIGEFSGYVGNFTSRLEVAGKSEKPVVRHGVAIVATGGAEVATSEHSYGRDGRIMTLLEMEARLASTGATGWRSAVFIGCVGSRDPGRTYCSRVCCGQMVKCAVKMKQAHPETDVHVIYRDIRTYGFSELLYRKAAELGVRFIRYDREHEPTVSSDGGSLKVRVADTVLHKDIEIPADVIGLAVGVDPAPGSEDLSRMLKVPLNEQGFFLEAHLKLKPVEFAAEGIFLCGMAHSPKSIDECISQARAAAARAGVILAHDKIEAPGVIASVDVSKCIGCGVCRDICPFEAAVLGETAEGGRAEIVAASCKGCGQCAARCPTRAITINCFSDDQVLSQVAAAVGGGQG